jgi:hypothetical protein
MKSFVKYSMGCYFASLTPSASALCPTLHRWSAELASNLIL